MNQSYFFLTFARVISLCHGQECMYYVCMIMGVLHHFQQYFSYHNIENVSVWCVIDDIITQSALLQCDIDVNV